MGFREDIKKGNFQSTMSNNEYVQSTDADKIGDIVYDVDSVISSLGQLVIAIEKRENIEPSAIKYRIIENINNLKNARENISNLNIKENTEEDLHNDKNDEIGPIL